MKPADRQKMCPNCDGRIPFDATQCPYCFTTSLGEGPAPKNQSIEDSLSALYTPPYQARSNEPEEKKAPFTRASEKSAEPIAVPLPERAEEGTDATFFWPILLLALAGNLFTLGVLQFFFSEQGVVRLEMSSGYWFLFVVLSVPLSYFGLKMLNKSKG